MAVRHSCRCWRRWWRLLLALIAVVVSLATAAAPATTPATARHVNVLNESGAKVEIAWLHPTTRATSLMSTPYVMNGASWAVDSFVGHEFEVKELANNNKKCRGKEGECRKAYFVVSENDDQVITITREMEIIFMDDQLRAEEQAGELVRACQTDLQSKLSSTTTTTTPEQVQFLLQELVSCVESGVVDTLAKANEEIAFQSQVRKAMAAQMENYTCADEDADTTKALESRVWRGSRDGKSRRVHVLLDREASRIHLLENFIDPEECVAMELAAKPKLHRATVADGKGGSHFSENRKAMQAGIKVPWEKEVNDHQIARLSRRVYDYTQYELELGIDEFGQEDLMSIQYFGKGKDAGNDTVPDRYTPHCDGDCNGLSFKNGTRMATMVMYCAVPESGGHTNFRNAGVHIRPQAGNAIFFSYIDPDTKLMDNGFTEHSGCPVWEGEKKIVTQWIRLGVDKENPWDSFNTLGIKKSNEDEDEDTNNGESESEHEL